MGKRRSFRKQRKSRRKEKPPGSLYLLDEFSSGDIRKWEKTKNELIAFQWQYYSELAHQRSQIIEQIRTALFNATEGPFSFKNWQRTVKYKYALEPLSAIGSLRDPGGRFNTGEIDPIKFTPFPALYFAEGKDTALQEMLCHNLKKSSDLTPYEFALKNKASITIVSVSGFLERVINLNQPKKLKAFIDLIKDFKIPHHLVKAARKLKLPSPGLIRTVSNLMNFLLDPEWRAQPMQLDVPAAPQIFGQLVYESGIEGIVYPSKFSVRDCLAVYPKNFHGSTSYVQLDDEPPEGTKFKRLDSSSWRLLV